MKYVVVRVPDLAWGEAAHGGTAQLELTPENLLATLDRNQMLSLGLDEEAQHMKAPGSSRGA